MQMTDINSLTINKWLIQINGVKKTRSHLIEKHLENYKFIIIAEYKY